MTAPALAQSQQLFQDYLLRGASSADELVAADAKADATTRLGVYADAYRLRLLEVLGNDYPALRAFAGAESFERIGRAYIETHPSDTPSVRWFGRHLPEFLRATEVPAALPPTDVPLPHRGRGEGQARSAWRGEGARRAAQGWDRYELLAELAAFEWSKSEVFDAPEAQTLEIAAVAAVPPESWPEMRLLTQPALRRLDLRWNVTVLCQAQEAQQELPQAEAAGEMVHWLLWRDAELDIRWRSLGEDEAAALDAALGGASFGAICELLCQWVEAGDAAMHAAGLLKRWIFDGLVTELEGV
ncbi:MAG TPA: DNA-binding domain-containing protein [Nevskia sp.]|nr:DNA-binding domain-containing protein [Nevskia sp.]